MGPKKSQGLLQEGDWTIPDMEGGMMIGRWRGRGMPEKGPSGAPVPATHHERDGADEHHQGSGDE